MRITLTLITAALLALSGSLSAQNRYIDPLFEVGEPTTITYGQNIDVFLRNVNSLEADVYEPEDDDAELRPLVVVWPTGNFLIQYLNQGPYGSLRDSAAVEVIDRLVSRGYVGMVAEYRTGWLPSATIQDVRTSTLLQAAYRGGQDAHSLGRYIRETVVNGNPMRIDTNRIVYWGLGTGGYVAMTHAFLDDIDEVLADDRFFGEDDEPYVSLAANADPKGLLPAAVEGVPTNIPNNLGFESNVAMSVNMGGALGDLDWMTGAEDEPIVLGYHSPSDIFAPYSLGTVVVPTTNDIVISGVSGTQSILAKANELGLNDAIIEANAAVLDARFGALSTAVNQTNEFYKSLTVDLRALGQDSATVLSWDNMFPLSVGDMRTATRTVSSPYNWLDSTRVRAEIADFNDERMQMIDASAVINNEILTNPNAYDAEGARLVFDTIMAHFIPRAYIGMDLDALVSTNDVVAPDAINFKAFPNPSKGDLVLQTDAANPIRSVRVADLNGRIVASYSGINQSIFTMPRNNLPRGTYLIQLQLDAGVSVRKVIFE